MIGCVVEDTRKPASRNVPFLSNENDQICYFNSALISLFAGHNALVPWLNNPWQDKNAASSSYGSVDTGAVCYVAVRYELAKIVKAMRNTNHLDKDKYVMPMFASVHLACWEFLGDALEAVVSLEGSTAKAVMMILLLPSLGVRWDLVDLRHKDCVETRGMTECVLNMLEAAAAEKARVAGEVEAAGSEANTVVKEKGRSFIGPVMNARHLVMVDFNIFLTTIFPDGFRLYDAPKLVLPSGAKYLLMSGTAARFIPTAHNVAFTVNYDSGTPILTLYDDSTSVGGVFVYDDIEAGFKAINAKFRLSTLTYVSEKALDAVRPVTKAWTDSTEQMINSDESWGAIQPGVG